MLYIAMMASKATHPWTRTVVTSCQFRRTTAKDLSAHNSVPKHLSKRFSTNCFCNLSRSWNWLKNHPGTCISFQSAPRPSKANATTFGHKE